jgi:adenylate cyclase
VVISPLYVGAVASDVDIEGLGLLDGLDGQAREERAELVAWLLDQDFSVEQIRKAISAMLLPAGRVVGDDGMYVSAREICAETGIDMELLKRLQRAFGLPRVDDPDVAVYLRADGEAAARVKLFVDVGLRPERVVTVARVLGDGLAQAAG